jgi:hypothetical protein
MKQPGGSGKDHGLAAVGGKPVALGKNPSARRHKTLCDVQWGVHYALCSLPWERSPFANTPNGDLSRVRLARILVRRELS